MNVVDSSAWISYFTDDRNADVFAAPIEDVENLLVPSITLTEVFKFMSRHADEAIALQAIAHMKQGMTVPLDGSLALDAAVFGLEFNLPLADSIVYATAKKFGAVVWTQDSDFKNLPAVEYYP
ncbi:type II toxin-antitoxin system VapC family toxin [Pseudomonadota bacterium]